MSISTLANQSQPKLANLPITFFAIGIGMMGLTLALRAAETGFAVGHGVSMVVLAVSTVMLGAITAGYLAKAFHFPDKVAEDWPTLSRLCSFRPCRSPCCCLPPRWSRWPRR